MNRGQRLSVIWAAWSRPALALRGKSRSAFSTKPDDIKPEASQKARSRIVRIASRLPRFLQGYTTPLISAPLTHISAFLLLHELTAVLPLFGLAATFHYTQWMPPFIGEGKCVSDGVEKFGNYFRKKGWLGEEGKARRYRWWGRGEGGTRIVVECVRLAFTDCIARNGLGLLELTKRKVCHSIRNHKGTVAAESDPQCLGNPLVCQGGHRAGHQSG